MGKRSYRSVGSPSGQNMRELHGGFVVFDRKGIDAITTLLEDSLAWQERALKIIKKLRRRNGKKK